MCRARRLRAGVDAQRRPEAHLLRALATFWKLLCFDLQVGHMNGRSFEHRPPVDRSAQLDFVPNAVVRDRTIVGSHPQVLPV